MAFIHHVFDPHLPLSKRRGVGTQALTPLGSVYKEGTYDPATFFTDSHNLFLRNEFCADGEFFELTESRARGRTTSSSDGDVDDHRRMTTTVTTVDYDFSIESLVGWGGGYGDRQYSVAGWLSALPLFDPHYQVLISRGVASGYVHVSKKSIAAGSSTSSGEKAQGGDDDEGKEEYTVTERRFDFNNAAVYLEKNWGGTFPTRWWWMQANTFSSVPSLSVTSTGAIRALPITGQQEEVALVGIHWDGQFLPFPFVSWTVRWGSWVIRGTYKEYVVTLLGRCDKEGESAVPVRCPTPDGMQDAALETYSGELRLILKKRVGGRGGMLETLVDATTNNACLEVGGLSWFEKGGKEVWEGRSAMAEPLKSIVMNVEAERAGADALQLLKKFVEIPGL
mmetsp:Transcript_55709/g.82925  ORF Transcript_55709/g.82925 Transcript_55709/m.82925 type:complete len:394 (-) Transcript_55709:236-1417(-)